MPRADHLLVEFINGYNIVTYQENHATGSSLVLSTLREEDGALASLLGPGSMLIAVLLTDMGDRLDWLLREPEVVLGEVELPKT
jgi:hypothetical protein